MKAIRVLLADDHITVRDGLKAILEADGLCSVVAQAADGIEAVDLIRTTPVDVAIVDLSMPKLNGLEVVHHLIKIQKGIRILVLTCHPEAEYVLPLVRAGAHGYLVKDTSAKELRRTVKYIANGGSSFGPQASAALAHALQVPVSQQIDDPYHTLTLREREVMQLVCEGNSTKNIAKILGISIKTAENHRYRTMHKLQLKNTAELVRYAVRRKLID